MSVSSLLCVTGPGSNAVFVNTSNANVGIGQSNPAYSLDILGDLNITGNLRSNGVVTGAPGAVCQALWYASSNVPASNYVGATAYGGTIVQNNSTTGTVPFATATGLFTCQYTGSYQCNFTAAIAGTSQVNVVVYRNGSAIEGGYLCYGNVNNSISVSGSIYCNAQDTLGFYVLNGTVQGGSGTTGTWTSGCSISLMTSGTAATGLGVPNQVVFTSGSSTWTVPSGVTGIQVEMVGAGGSGSACGNANSTPGGGGGAGQYIRANFPVAAGGTITYSVGTGGGSVVSYNTAGAAGGNTTLSYASGGTTYFTATCNGGSGGIAANGSASSPGWSGIGGTGGTITSSLTYTSLNQPGGDGQSGSIAAGGAPGNGGASYFGGGGGYTGGTGASYSGKSYGSGGCGSQASFSSGAGANGVVIITYFTQSGVPATYTATAPLSVSGTTLSYQIQSGTSLTYSATGGIMEFTGIPSWAKRITLMLQTLQHTNATADSIIVQLGSSSGYATSSYNSYLSYVNGGNGWGSFGSSLPTNGASIGTPDMPSSMFLTGIVTFTLITGNKWMHSGSCAYASNGATFNYNGYCNGLTASVTRLRIGISTNSSINMIGTANIIYE